MKSVTQHIMLFVENLFLQLSLEIQLIKTGFRVTSVNDWKDGLFTLNTFFHTQDFIGGIVICGCNNPLLVSELLLRIEKTGFHIPIILLERDCTGMVEVPDTLAHCFFRISGKAHPWEMADNIRQIINRQEG